MCPFPRDTGRGPQRRRRFTRRARQHRRSAARPRGHVPSDPHGSAPAAARTARRPNINSPARSDIESPAAPPPPTNCPHPVSARQTPPAVLQAGTSGGQRSVTPACACVRARPSSLNSGHAPLSRTAPARPPSDGANTTASVLHRLRQAAKPHHVQVRRHQVPCRRLLFAGSVGAVAAHQMKIGGANGAHFVDAQHR